MAEMSRLDGLARALDASLGPGTVRAESAMSRHTTFRVGGPADLLVEARSVVALVQAVRLASEHGVPCRVLGSGANVLVSDSGIRGLVVLNRARTIRLEKGGVRAESGAALAQVARRSIQASLAGLEWAIGIPGTVGGAVVGNAGAFGGDVAQSLHSTSVLEAGIITEWPIERFAYGYRTSALKKQAPGSRSGVTILAASFRLGAGDRQTIETRAASYLARRSATQPAGASCGSVFMNPAGDFAGRLIESAGLKGCRHGGAQISPVHANFVLNLGGASAASVKALIDRAVEEVGTRFGVTLELEIELLGEW